MALSLIAMTASNAVVRNTQTGHAFTATSTGQVTIPVADAAAYNTSTLMVNLAALISTAPSGAPAPVIPQFWQGATADRPPVVAPGTGALSMPPPAGSVIGGPSLGMFYNDTTLTKIIMWVDKLIASTGWVDVNGTAV